jgi:hypothetical protein
VQRRRVVARSLQRAVCAVMPPRRSAGAADSAEDAATTALSPLPLSVVLHIFSLLPVDTRLRCSEVCRGWHSVLLERSLWTRLDMSATSGVRAREGANRGALDGLLRCAAARAGGGLMSLQVNTHHLPHAPLLEVVAANAGALRELHALGDKPFHGCTPEAAEALCGAAPLLRIFATDLYGDRTVIQAARRALRNEAPFGPLHVRHLIADLHNEDEAGVEALAADVATHASLERLTLEHASLDAPAVLDVMADAALARRLRYVTFDICFLSPASAPALARLLGSDALTTLVIRNTDMLAAGGRALAAALRANSTLTKLSLYSAGVLDEPAAAAELLGALTGHASLQVLKLQQNHTGAAHRAAAGTLLGALVTANAPALTHLDVSYCLLGDNGMRPLFEALPANTHLRTLKCYNNNMSDAFSRDVLLPAVRSNETLRELAVVYIGGGLPHAQEAARLVQRRA